MADTTTPFLNLTKPEVNGVQTENVWGFDVNLNFDKIDAFAAGTIGTDAPSDGYIYGRGDGDWERAAAENHTHPVTDVVGLIEAVDDHVAGPGGLIRAGTNVSINYDDALGIMTINAVQGFGSNVADGDWGDITVSGGGSSMQFDPTVVSPAARTVLDDTTVAAMRVTLGAAATTHTHAWTDITSTPAAFPPSAHGHVISDVNNLQATLDAKSWVGHGHSTAEIGGLDTALNGKVAKAGDTMTGALHALGGIRMGGNAVTVATDLTKHLDLNGSAYGMSVRNDGVVSIVSQGQAAFMAASTNVTMPGAVTVGNLYTGTLVQSSAAALILGANGDAVYMRPYGASNGASQAYLRTDGWFLVPHIQTNVIQCTTLTASGGRVLSQGTSTGPGSNPTVSVYNISSGYAFGFWTTGAEMYFGSVDGNGGAGIDQMMITSMGDFAIRGFSAVKVGGGVWAASSDERIKNVLGNYDSGLAAVQQLQPVRYTYKGNDTRAPAEGEAAPYENSPHKQAATDAVEFIGLIAQATEAAMPEMVKQRAGYIDGAAVTDLRDLDTGPLIFALINAVKELAAKVEALESAP